jgi:aspartyl protease family protein
VTKYPFIFIVSSVDLKKATVMHKPYLIAIILLIALICLLLWQFPYAISSSDDKGNVIYMLLLIILLGSSALLHYRGRVGELLRHSVLWILILLVIVAGYSYRDVLMNNRIVSSLMPQKPMIQADGTMIFHAAQDGHFYIEAVINGVKIEFMADTGASDISISPDDARRLGIDLHSLSYSKRYYTANGVVHAAPVTLDNFTVGTVTIQNMPASVNGAEMGKSLLGMSFFKRLQGFSIQGEILTLNP